MVFFSLVFCFVFVFVCLFKTHSIVKKNHSESLKLHDWAFDFSICLETRCAQNMWLSDFRIQQIGKTASEPQRCCGPGKSWKLEWEGFSMQRGGAMLLDLLPCVASCHSSRITKKSLSGYHIYSLSPTLPSLKDDF